MSNFKRKREWIATFLKWNKNDEAVDVCDIIVTARSAKEAGQTAYRFFASTDRFSPLWKLEDVSTYCSGCGATNSYDDDCLCDYFVE
jgi:hypothetical protein